MDKVFILRDDREIGPYDAEELRSRIQLAVLDPEETCRDTEGEEWTCREWLDAQDEVGEMEEEEDEFPAEVLWQGHPSMFHYMPSICLFLLLTGGGIALLCWRFDLWIGAALAAAGLALLGVALIHRGTRRFIISERRVELIYGLLSKSSQEILIEDIRAINVRKSGISGLFGIGNVEFSSAGSSDVEVAFNNVGRAASVKQIVREIQDDLPIATDD